jgi:galactose mutarotase-like enzyme
MTAHPSFKEIIETNMGAERVPVKISSLETEGGTRLDIRNRGCFVTDFSIVGNNGKRTTILYADTELDKAKLNGSHSMSPVGQSDGIGGQHGFARWVDYDQTPQPDGDDGEKLALFEARSREFGVGLSKVFDIRDDSLTTRTTLLNRETTPLHTSLGEHLYFALENESAEGLLLNGQTLDEVLGDGALEDIMAGNPHFWDRYRGNNAEITFPAGHIVDLGAAAMTAQTDPHLGMLIWHRPGTPSICFEPTIGLTEIGINAELAIEPLEEVSLITFIDVRPAI